MGCCGPKLTNEEAIERAKRVHGERYIYDEKFQYLGNKKPVIIKCRIHGYFTKQFSYHMDKAGCPQCYIENARETSRSFTNEIFTKRGKEMHGEKFDYSLVNGNSYHNKVTLICKVCGHKFHLKAYAHLRYGGGCAKCRNEKQKYTQEEALNYLKEIHGASYDYSLVVYKNAKTKIIVICPKHGQFSISFSKHVKGQGCNKCQQSHGERKVRKFLDKLQVDYQTEVSYLDLKYKNKLRFDFLVSLKSGVFLIEYQGEQHYNVPKNRRYQTTEESIKLNKKRDRIKRKYCKKNNILLLEIKYTKFKKIEEVVMKFIKEKFPNESF